MSERLAWQYVDERPGPAGFLRVHTRRYLMPNGRISEWDILQGGRTVALLALTPDGDIVLVQQFRPGPDRVLMELPGGIVVEDEEILDAAARELREETGYVATDMMLVGQTWLAGYATHQRYAVLATRCRQLMQRSLDEDEYSQPILLSREDFLAHLRTGDLTDTDIAYMCLDRLGLVTV